MSHLVPFPEDLYARFAAVAANRGQTPDELIVTLARETIEQEEEEEGELSPDDPFLKLAGIIDIPVERGWADRHDEYFAGAEDDSSKP